MKNYSKNNDKLSAKKIHGRCKITFLQPRYAHYRDKLYTSLSQNYDIYFIFESSKNTYPGDATPLEIKYSYLNQIPFFKWICLIYHFLPGELRCYAAISNKKMNEFKFKSEYAMKDWKSMAHVKWECDYHIVFIPKYRKKKLYGHLRKRIGGIFHELCRYKGIELLEGNAMPDHVHICLNFPPIRE